MNPLITYLQLLREKSIGVLRTINDKYYKSKDEYILILKTRNLRQIHNT